MANQIFMCSQGHKAKESEMNNTTHCIVCGETMVPLSEWGHESRQIYGIPQKILIIAHGDLDGITSVALLAEKLGIAPEYVQVIFTQPFLVDKVKIPDEVEQVYVVDIAINNKDPEMTMNFIAKLGSKLVYWFDHHKGWLKSMTYHFVIDDTVPACAVMFGIPPTDIRVYNACVADTRDGTLQLEGALIDEAIKSDMRNDEIRLAATKLLMGDESQRSGLETAAKAYAAIQAETEQLADFYEVDGDIAIQYTRNQEDLLETEKVTGVDYLGQVAVVDVLDHQTPDHDYDLTQLLLKGQELADFAVAKTISPDDREMVTVATKSGVNLVELFELPSGAPSRVSLPVNRLEEVVEKLRNLSG